MSDRAPIAKEQIESARHSQEFGAFSGAIDFSKLTGTPTPQSKNVARGLTVNGAVTVRQLNGSLLLLPDYGPFRWDMQIIGLDATSRTATSVIVHW